MGDPKVARMARKRKRCVTPFPTFCEEIPRKYNVRTERQANDGGSNPGRLAQKTAPVLAFAGTGQWRLGRNLSTELLGSRRLLLALQLALERFDLFGQRNILAHQRLDLAHGVQHRGVIASAEPAADFRQ